MNWKKRILFLLLMIPAILFSQDWGALGLTVEESVFEGGREIFTLKTQDGMPITYTTEEVLTSNQATLISGYISIFLDWETIKVKKIHFQVTPNRIGILVVPETVVINDEDLSGYLPAGLQFFYRTFLEYSFRMEKEQLFMHLRGQYLDEEKLVNEIKTAAADPVRYIEIHDPDFFVEQLLLFQNEISLLESSLETEQGKVQELEKEEAAQAERITQLEGQVTELQSELSDLEGQFTQLEKEFQTARYAIVGINNRNFFNIIKDFDSDLIDKIVEQKEASPSSDADAILAALKEQGVTGADKTLVSLVLMAFYNEFE